jgi:hypothetical protein
MVNLRSLVHLDLLKEASSLVNMQPARFLILELGSQHASYFNCCHSLPFLEHICPNVPAPGWLP